MPGKSYTRIVNVVALENLQAVKMHFGSGASPTPSITTAAAWRTPPSAAFAHP